MPLLARHARALRAAAPRARRLNLRNPPTAGQLQAIAGRYEAALIQLAEDVSARVSTVVEPVMVRLLEQQRERDSTSFYRDADELPTDLERALEDLTGELERRISTPRISDLVDATGADVDVVSRTLVAGQLRASLSISLPDPADTSVPLRQWAQDNARLISTLPARHIAGVELLSLRALSEGWTPNRFTNELRTRTGTTRTIARRIARDQVGKLQGQLTAERHQGLGVTHFFWRTVGDERVRDEHDDLDGKRFSYADPPEIGLPGYPIQCRCWAEPDFSTAGEGLPEPTEEEEESQAGQVVPEEAGELEVIPEEPLPRTPQLAPPRSVEDVLGPNLIVTDRGDPQVMEHLRALEQYPPRLYELLRERGVEVYIGRGGVPGLDDLGELRGVRPRGWDEGDTWDQVGGAYFQPRGIVAVGTAEGASASGSAALHEIAHAVGFRLGFQGEDGTIVAIHDDPEFVELHRALHEAGRLDPYLAQGGPGGEAGRQELFAEGISTFYARGPDKVTELWGGDLTAYFARLDAAFR